MRQTIRLNERQLRQLISEVAFKVLNEATMVENLAEIEQFIDSDTHIQRLVDWIKGAIVRKIQKGIAPKLEVIANSSDIRNIIKDAINDYVLFVRRNEKRTPLISDQQEDELRKYVAGEILGELNAQN